MPDEKTSQVPEDDSATSTNLKHAELLYSHVIDLRKGCTSIDEPKARLIVEYANDAIRCFGTTNHAKKIELRTITEQAEQIIPPDSIESLRKRGEKLLLRLIYPKDRRLRNAILGAIGILILASSVYPIISFAFTSTPESPALANAQETLETKDSSAAPQNPSLTENTATAQVSSSGENKATENSSPKGKIIKANPLQPKKSSDLERTPDERSTASVTDGVKNVLVMDSRANTKANNQLIEILNPFVDAKKIAVTAVAVEKDWGVNRHLVTQKPDLVIIHVSAYFSETNVRAADNYVMDFINRFADDSKNTKFLVYSGAFKDWKVGRDWTWRMKEKYTDQGKWPSFLSRLDTIWFPHTEEVPEDLRIAIKNIIAQTLDLHSEVAS